MAGWVGMLITGLNMLPISQLDGGSLRSGPMRWTRTLLGKKDYFMRAEPPPTPGLKEHDLFAGL